MSNNRITTRQKKYINTLSEDLTDAEFDALIEATSFVESEIISKDSAPEEKSRVQKIANMSTRHASELIEILRNPELREQYVFFADKLKTA